MTEAIAGAESVSSPRTATRPSPFVRTRLAIVVTLALLIGLAAVRLAFIRGTVGTRRVSGGSMAESLCGAHYLVNCRDCDIRFRCDAEHVPADERAVCPNCGSRDNPLRPADLRPGDRVLVDAWPFHWSMPQRGEVVMLREPMSVATPGDQYEYAVKRVAAVAGERLEIRDGDLYAGGELLRKSLAELREVAVLVHDNHHLPGGHGPFVRWKPGRADSQWRSTENVFRFEPAPVARGNEPDFLAYEHWRCDGSLASRTEPAEILDNDPYNQGESRQLNLVHDLLLDFEARLTPGALLTCVLRDRDETFHVSFDTLQYQVLVNAAQRELASAALPRPSIQRPVKVQVALCDQQVLVGWNGQTLLQVRYSSRKELSSAANQIAAGREPRLQVGAAGARVELARLRVYRDIYHLEPHGTGRPWSAEGTLPAGHFALLGDNAPISMDSRHWAGEGIALRQIQGRICRVMRTSRP